MTESRAEPSDRSHSHACSPDGTGLILSVSSRVSAQILQRNAMILTGEALALRQIRCTSGQEVTFELTLFSIGAVMKAGFPIPAVATGLAILLTSSALSQESSTDDRQSAGNRVSSVRIQLGSAQAHARGLSQAFHEATERIRPSVVSIHSEKRIAPESDQRFEAPPNLPPEFERFFGEDFFNRFRSPQQGYVQRGFGTGVIVSSDGYIVTNSHVIRGAGEIQVRLEDGRDFSAKVVGNDHRTEIAVIQIPATGLKAAALGNSDDLKVGQWVLAVGNPMHLTQTVTAGIVSARGRSNVGITDFEDFIQTDAAINPGNSGGPLINLNGEVIGINTAIATRTGGYMGIGFAIPSNMVQSVMDQLIEHGHVARGLMGVIVQPLTADLAESFGFSGTDGVLIADVVPDGPAAKAGLRSGDIVRKLNGQPTTSTTEVRNRIAELKPGTVVRVDYFRDGHLVEVDVTLDALDGEEASAADGPSSPPSPSGDLKLGMQLQDVTPDIMTRLGNDPEQAGVMVTRITPGGPAEDGGLRASDVIIAVNNESISDTEGFRRAVTKATTAGVRLQVLRAGRRLFAFLKLPSNDQDTDAQ